MPSAAQTRAIHVLRRNAGLDDKDYRALLHSVAGVASSRDLDDAGARRLLDHLTALAGSSARARGKRPASRTATGRFAPILQALWIAGYNLGVVRSKDDAAMLAFVQRQTNVAHTQFLQDPKEARRAIEAIKSWLAREAGVDWPPDRPGDDEAGVNRKRAVAKAIAERLQACGGFTPFCEGDSVWPGDIELYAYRIGFPAAFAFYEPRHWDDLCNRLGARLRASLARQAKQEAR